MNTRGKTEDANVLGMALQELLEVVMTQVVRYIETNLKNTPAVAETTAHPRHTHNRTRLKAYKGLSWSDAVCEVMLSDHTRVWCRNEIKSLCTTLNLNTQNNRNNRNNRNNEMDNEKKNEYNFRSALNTLRTRGHVRKIQTGLWKLEPEGIDYAIQRKRKK